MTWHATLLGEEEVSNYIQIVKSSNCGRSLVSAACLRLEELGVGFGFGLRRTDISHNFEDENQIK